MSKPDDFVPVASTKADRQIESALDLLREASPSADLPLRIRRRLAEPNPSDQRSSSRWQWPVFAATTIIAFFCVLPFLLPGVPSANHSASSPSGAVSASLPPPHGSSSLPGPAPLQSPPSLSSRPEAALLRPERRDPCISDHHGFVHQQENCHSASLRSAAISITRRVSTSAPTREPVAGAASEATFDHPAPELPLTAQEQMLLRIAYGNRPPQVASLKRFILPRPAEDEPDFDKFFEPYTTPLTEGNPQ